MSLDVIDCHSLQYKQSLDTQGFGTFSLITSFAQNKAYLGSYEGHFFVCDLEDGHRIL
jgi:hypothetical protein